jgi:hypothetical protein
MKLSNRAKLTLSIALTDMLKGQKKGGDFDALIPASGKIYAVKGKVQNGILQLTAQPSAA